MRSIIEQAAAALADNLRYDAPAGKWMLWSGTHWQHDDTLAAFDLARLICRQISRQVPSSLAAAVASAQTIAAVERRAKALALAKARHDVR